MYDKKVHCNNCGFYMRGYGYFNKHGAVVFTKWLYNYILNKMLILCAHVLDENSYLHKGNLPTDVFKIICKYTYRL